MKRSGLVMILFHFGDWPEWIDLYVETCKYNPSVDWIVFTDYEEPENKSDNVRYIRVASENYSSTILKDIHKYVSAYDNYFFTNIYTLYGDLKNFYIDNKITDALYDKREEWYWSSGRLTNNRDKGGCVDYQEFSVYNISRLVECEWKNLDKLIHFDFKDMTQGFVVSDTGFHLVSQLQETESNLGGKDKIQIHLNTNCNMSCHHCSSFSNIGKHLYLSIEKLNSFIEESINIGKEWKKIWLIGGEPSLYPYLKEAIGILDEYRKEHKSCEIIFSTNGFSDKTKKIIDDMPAWMTIENSNKKSINNCGLGFSTCYVAPIDLTEYDNADFSIGCSIADYCGIALNENGYFPCSPSANIDRVLNLNCSIEKLEDILNTDITKIFDNLCGKCGFYKKPLSRVFSNISDEPVEPSELWRNKFEE